MRVFKYLIILPILLFSKDLFSQETVDKSGVNSQDSIAMARRKEYEEALKRMEENRRRREEDPQGYADSIARVKEQRAFTRAVKRIEDYRDQNLNEILELDLTGARLKEIPAWIYDAEKLEVLVLDQNQISGLPNELSRFKNLKRIYWRNNGLVHNGLKIPKLEGIEKIDLSDNAFTKLPKVHRLKGLEELILEGNQLTKIPTWRGRRLKDLKELDISRNPIQLDKRWYGMLDHIEILKLNKCELTAIDPSIYKMTGLHELQIQVNNLENIPEGISAFQKLTKLSFYKNNLNQLPTDFYQLSQLTVVDFYYNDFEKIPSEIGKLTNLEILYLSFNKLYDLPKEIGKLTKLRELYIHHNRLSEIPEDISNLGSLRVLHFQENYIPEFPVPILSMESLKDLDISNTDIRRIPKGITKLPLRNFYWRNLEINLNSPDNEESRKSIMELMNKGTNVVPKVSMQEISSN